MCIREKILLLLATERADHKTVDVVTPKLDLNTVLTHGHDLPEQYAIRPSV